MKKLILFIIILSVYSFGQENRTVRMNNLTDSLNTVRASLALKANNSEMQQRLEALEDNIALGKESDVYLQSQIDSLEVRVNALQPDYPLPPTELVANATSTMAGDLSWKGGFRGYDAAIIDSSGDGTTYAEMVRQVGSDSTYTKTGLLENHLYRFYVSFFDSATNQRSYISNIDTMRTFPTTAPSIAIIDADYYIDGTNGNDANDGRTPTTAWKNLSKLDNTTSLLAAGDTVAIRDSMRYTQALYFTDSGTSGNPIVLTNWYGSSSGRKPVVKASNTVTTFADQGGNIWRASLTASSVNQVWFETNKDNPDSTYWGKKETSTGNLNVDMEWFFGSNYLYVYSTSDPDSRFQYVEANIQSAWNKMSAMFIQGNYVTVEYMDAKYGSAPAGNSCGGIWIGNNGNHHVIVQDCITSFNGNSGENAHGIMSNGVSYENIIRRNRSFENDDHGIYVWNNNGAGTLQYNILIDSNIVYNNWHSQIDVNTGNSSLIDSVVISRNTLYISDNWWGKTNTSFLGHYITSDGMFLAGQGLTATVSVSDIYVVNNLFKNITAGSIDVDDNAYSNIQPIYIYSNTFYNSINKVNSNDKGPLYIQNDGQVVKFQNNIVYSTGEYPLIQVGSKTNKTMSNNLYYFDGSVTAPFVLGSTTYTTLANWMTASGETSSTNDEAHFTTNGSDFTLQATSHAIGMGSALGAPFNIDILGITRPVGGTYDAGCYEYNP